MDLIINATSASLSGEVPPIASSLIEPGKTVCYDMMYGKEPTSFCRWASEHGAAVAMDGLGMLAERAAKLSCGAACARIRRRCWPSCVGSSPC